MNFAIEQCFRNSKILILDFFYVINFSNFVEIMNYTYLSLYLSSKTITRLGISDCPVKLFMVTIHSYPIPVSNAKPSFIKIQYRKGINIQLSDLNFKNKKF